LDYEKELKKKEKIELDNAVLRSLGIEENDIDTVRNEIYDELIKTINVRLSLKIGGERNISKNEEEDEE
jgi:protein-arginine kinase